MMSENLWDWQIFDNSILFFYGNNLNYISCFSFTHFYALDNLAIRKYLFESFHKMIGLSKRYMIFYKKPTQYYSSNCNFITELWLFFSKRRFYRKCISFCFQILLMLCTLLCANREDLIGFFRVMLQTLQATLNCFFVYFSNPTFSRYFNHF